MPVYENIPKTNPAMPTECTARVLLVISKGNPSLHHGSEYCRMDSVDRIVKESSQVRASKNLGTFGTLWTHRDCKGSIGVHSEDYMRGALANSKIAPSKWTTPPKP